MVSVPTLCPRRAGGLRRVRCRDGTYYWILPQPMKPVRILSFLDPAEEAGYRFRLAMEHLARAERAAEAGDWAGTAASSQLGV